MKFNDLSEKGQHMHAVKRLLEQKKWDEIMVVLTRMMHKWPEDQEIKNIYSTIKESEEYKVHLDSDSGELPF